MQTQHCFGPNSSVSSVRNCLHGMRTRILILSSIAAALVVLVIILQARSVDGPIASNQAISYTTQELRTETAAVHGSAQARYPVFVGLPAAHEQQINAMMAQIVERRVDAFFKNLGQKPREDVGPGLEGSTLDLSFTVITPQQHPAILDIIFTESSYYQGAAHPNQVAFSYVFDIRSGARLALADLFDAKDDVYVRVAQLSRDALQKQFAAADIEEGGWFPEGVEPKEENFQVFALTDAGLQLVFNPYQVAPYAAGMQQVTVPFDALTSLRPHVWR